MTDSAQPIWQDDHVERDWQNFASQMNQATAPLLAGVFHPDDQGAIMWKPHPGTKSTNFQPHIRTEISSEAISPYYHLQLQRFLGAHGFHVEVKNRSMSTTFLVITGKGGANDSPEAMPHMTQGEINHIQRTIAHDTNGIMSQRPDIASAINILNKNLPVEGNQWTFVSPGNHPLHQTGLVLETGQGLSGAPAQIMDHLVNAGLRPEDSRDWRNNVVISLRGLDVFERVRFADIKPLNPPSKPLPELTMDAPPASNVALPELTLDMPAARRPITGSGWHHRIFFGRTPKPR